MSNSDDLEKLRAKIEGKREVMDFMLDLMAEAGDIRAKCLKKQTNITDLISDEIFNKYLLNSDKPLEEEKQNIIYKTLESVEKILKDLAKDLEENNQ